MVKLRRQFAFAIATTTKREGGRDRTRRKWQSDHGVLFLVGGFALGSLCNETPKTAGMFEKAQLTPVNKHHCVTKRDGSHVRNPIEAATRIRLVV